MEATPSTDAMYRALVERDASFDGLFVAAIKTTGIFCRPTCPARKPKRSSVEFFRSAHDAVRAGYRACKRCRPNDTHAHAPAWVARLVRTMQREPGRPLHDADLRRAQVEPSRVKRYFLANYGMTFHAYHRALRMGRALAALRAGHPLERVAADHGFRSLSGFREAFEQRFGHPPGRHEAVRCLQAHWIDTRLGALLAVAGDEGLALLEFVDRCGLDTQIAALRRSFDAAIVPGRHAHLEAAEREIRPYFDGSSTTFEVPLAVRGSVFQNDVWSAMLEIPPGETRSYRDIAVAVGRPNAVRAVGRAGGENRLALVIPCHRVVRSDGTLSGYGGGRWRKQWLLDHERVTISGAVLS